MVESPNSFRRHEGKLAKAQRKLSRKEKGSENWKKQKQEVARLHHRISNVRNDYLHKLSTEIGKNHATVYVEKLNIRGMSSSAKGSKEDPGRNVRAKAGLNKSILDQGWYEFRRQLAYKLEWSGGSLVEVDARYSSQRCSKCGHTEKDNRRSQAEFVCLSCGEEQHADANAARNILTVGQMGVACGSSRSGERKQELAGNSDEVLPMAS
jgi:putative transposase